MTALRDCWVFLLPVALVLIMAAEVLIVSAIPDQRRRRIEQLPGRKAHQMKAKAARFLLVWIIRYLRDHPTLIPGEVDDRVVRQIASALGV